MFLTKIFYIAIYTAVVCAQRDSSSTNTAADGSSDTTLSPDAIQSGSFVDGSQQIGAAEAGQALSSTSQNNFINNCAGKVLTNGLQITSGSCNGITMGDIPAKSAMVSSTIIFPKTGKTIPSDTTFQIQVQMANIVAGSFTNADATYYAAPQTLSGGLVVGHTHVTVQDMGNSLNPTNALDPTQFAFFKGINDAGNGNGLLSANVTGGLPAGNYRVCTMASASNHQPVLMPVAQRGTADDCTKFVVTGDGNTPNAASNDGSGGQAAAAAAASAVAAGPGAVDSATGNAATPTTKSGGRKSKVTPSPSASNGNTSNGSTSNGNTNNGNTSNGNDSDGTSTGFGSTNEGSSGSGFQQDGTDTGSDSFSGQDFSDEQHPCLACPLSASSRKLTLTSPRVQLHFTSTFTETLHAAFSQPNPRNAHIMIDPALRLRRAIHANDALLVTRIIRSHPVLLRNPDSSDAFDPGLSNTSLHLASSLGHISCVRALLALGHEDDGISLNESHQTPLILAANKGHTEVVHLLCSECPAGIGKRDTWGRDAIMEAARGGHDTVLQILLTFALSPSTSAKYDNSKMLDNADVEGNTALHFASSNGHLLVLRTLLAAGADAEKRNGCSWRPVSYSATVQAEVYFKGLVAEVERRKAARAMAEGRGTGAGIRVVEDPDEGTDD